MPQWRETLSADPVNRVQAHLERDTEGLVLRHTADIEPLLDENKAMDTTPQQGRQGRLAARIPPHLYFIDWPIEFQMKHGEHPHKVAGEKRKECRKLWKEFVKRKINSPEFRYLRIDDGKKL